MSHGPEAVGVRAKVLEALHLVIDPEVGLDVVELGLVYGLEVEGSAVRVDLTMTTPACPLGEHITLDAQERIRAVEGVESVVVRLVWEPSWTPDRMSPKARSTLGWGA